MREIKFSIWDSEEKYMSEPITISELILQEAPLLAKHYVLQYTGLKDKYGKEVCEGDILRWKNALGYGEEIGSVGWGDDGFVWEGIPLAVHVAGLEIIGNIYENPELLK